MKEFKMLNRSLIPTLLCLAFNLSTLDAAAIDFAASDVTSNFVDSNSRVVGWQFTPNVSIGLTQLGFYDSDQNGLIDSHPIGVYTLTGTLLADATVPAGTSAPLSGLFRYVSLNSALQLEAGTIYVIGAFLPGNGDGWVWWPSVVGVNVINPSVDPAITIGAEGTARFDCCNVGSLQFPSQQIGVTYPGDPRVAFVGPNFQFTPTTVPEPSTFGYSLIALGMTKFYIRRRPNN